MPHQSVSEMIASVMKQLGMLAVFIGSFISAMLDYFQTEALGEHVSWLDIALRGVTVGGVAIAVMLLGWRIAKNLLESQAGVNTAQNDLIKLQNEALRLLMRDKHLEQTNGDSSETD